MLIGVWRKSKKTRPDFKEVRWDNTKGANSVSVVFDGAKWRVWEYDIYGYDDEIGDLKGYDSKKEALNIAKEFMRLHPNG